MSSAIPGVTALTADRVGRDFPKFRQHKDAIYFIEAAQLQPKEEVAKEAAARKPLSGRVLLLTAAAVSVCQKINPDQVERAVKLAAIGSVTWQVLKVAKNKFVSVHFGRVILHVPSEGDMLVEIEESSEAAAKTTALLDALSKITKHVSSKKEAVAVTQIKENDAKYKEFDKLYKAEKDDAAAPAVAAAEPAAAAPEAGGGAASSAAADATPEAAATAADTAKSDEATKDDPQQPAEAEQNEQQQQHQTTTQQTNKKMLRLRATCHHSICCSSKLLLQRPLRDVQHPYAKNVITQQTTAKRNLTKQQKILADISSSISSSSSSQQQQQQHQQLQHNMTNARKNSNKKNVVDFHRDDELYCYLCSERFGSWNEHRGKREHQVLELLFECIVDYYRDWSPSEVLLQFNNNENDNETKNRFQKQNKGRNFAPFQSILQFFDNNEQQRRRSVYSITKFLVDRGALFLGSKQWQSPALHPIHVHAQGQLVLFFWQHPQILRTLPYADCAQVSSFSQQVACMYNLGTAFDFLGLADLVDPRDLPNFVSKTRLQKVGGDPHVNKNNLVSVKHQKKMTITKKPYDDGPSSQLVGVDDIELDNISLYPANNNNNNNATSAADEIAPPTAFSNFLQQQNQQESSQQQTEEVIFWHRGEILRAILGQLRWALLGCPVHDNVIASQVLMSEPHLQVLATELASAIVTECIACRFAEYVTRAEAAWRAMGCPVSASTSSLRDLLDSSTKLSAETLKYKQQQQQQQQQQNRQEQNQHHDLSLFSPLPFRRTESLLENQCADLRGRGGAKAAERALSMLQGSFHDGLAAVLGKTHGSCQFQSAGAATTSAARVRFDYPAQDLRRVSKSLLQKRQREEERARRRVLSRKREKEDEKRRNAKKKQEHRNKYLFLTDDDFRVGDESVARKNAAVGFAPQEMSKTAERLLSEASRV